MVKGRGEKQQFIEGIKVLYFALYFFSILTKHFDIDKEGIFVLLPGWDLQSVSYEDLSTYSEFK